MLIPLASGYADLEDSADVVWLWHFNGTNESILGPEPYGLENHLGTTAVSYVADHGGVAGQAITGLDNVGWDANESTLPDDIPHETGFLYTIIGKCNETLSYNNHFIQHNAGNNVITLTRPANNGSFFSSTRDSTDSTASNLYATYNITQTEEWSVFHFGRNCSSISSTCDLFLYRNGEYVGTDNNTAEDGTIAIAGNQASFLSNDELNQDNQGCQISDIRLEVGNLTKDSKTYYTEWQNAMGSFTINATVNNIAIQKFEIWLNNSLEANITNGIYTAGNLSGANNFIIIADGFNTSTYDSWDVTNNLWSNHTIDNFDINRSLSYIGLYTNNDLNLVCNYSLEWAVDQINTTYTVWNINDTETWNDTLESTDNQGNKTHTYTINTTDLFDEIRYACYIWTPWGSVNYTTNLTINETQIDSRITFNAFTNTTTNLIGNVFWNYTDWNITDTANPNIIFGSEIFNLTNKTRYSYTYIYDTNLYHIPRYVNFTINETNLTVNFSLDPTQLTLQFYDDNEQLEATEGILSDTTPKNMYFQDSEIIVVQTNLSLGKVIVHFNNISSNFTQYYEYLNTWQDQVTDNLSLIDDADFYIYFQIVDFGNSPITDAIVRTVHVQYNASNPLGFEYGKLLGQRVTDDQGFAFFYGDYGDTLTVQITKEGYDVSTLLLIMGQENYEKADPYVVYLSESEDQSLYPLWAYTRRKYANDTITINGTIVVRDAESVKIATSYMDDNSLGNITLTGDSLERYTFTLDAGTHYDVSLQNDISLMIYIDDVHRKTLTIAYTDGPEESLFSNTGDIPLLAIIIGVLMITIAVGFTIKDEVLTFRVFMGGLIVAGMLNVSFLWLTVISAVWLIFELTKNVWSE